jgi:hypothetical protein
VVLLDLEGVSLRPDMVVVGECMIVWEQLRTIPGINAITIYVKSRPGL